MSQIPFVPFAAPSGGEQRTPVPAASPKPPASNGWNAPNQTVRDPDATQVFHAIHSPSPGRNPQPPADGFGVQSAPPNPPAPNSPAVLRRPVCGPVAPQTSPGMDFPAGGLSAPDPVEAFFRSYHGPQDETYPPESRSSPMNSSPYYDPLAQEGPVPPQAAPPTPPPPVVNAYNRDYGAAPRRPSRQAPVSQPVEPAPVWEPEDTGSPRTTPPRRRKRRKWPWVLLILVLLLVVVPVGFWFLFPSRPDNTVGKVGDVATFLLAGTDADGTRTDTMMLLYVNRDTDTINLLSLPRDSHVTVDGHDMKLNAVYSYGGCGQEGMELLMEQMKDVLGYRPDCYALFSLESIVELIDTMGGITFDVPMDMYYEDSAQDLYIDLQAGTQTLNGEQAVQVLRYRSGYALADLERVNVQREMVNAAMEQWLTLGNAFNGLRAIWNLTSDAVTNISTRNFLWLAQSALSADLGAMQSETLPGEWESPYYWLYRYDRADMINSYFNPTGITFSGEDYTR